MDTKTFLTRVSASLDDVVVCLWKPDPTGQNPMGVFWNRGSFSDYDAAAQAIQTWDQSQDWSVFFSVGRMANNKEVDLQTGKTKYRRTKAHASWFKALCFDQDVGADKLCKTQKEGLTAAVAAFNSLGLPVPMIVSSGRGIHYYWPLTIAISASEWEKLSDALAAALVSAGLQYDTSKIRDTSMILRPAGTHNKKQTPWLPVEVKADCEDFEPEMLEYWLDAFIGKRPAPAQQGVKKRSAIMDAVLKSCNLNIEAIGRKCAQVGALLGSRGEFDSAGNQVSEPLWRASLSLAAHAVDKDAALLLLCSGHPDFDHDHNVKKMEAWTAGPATCKEFEKHNSSGCAACPYRGQIASPASINEEQVQTPPTPAAYAQAAATQTVAPTMPDGYYVSNGAIYRDLEVETKDKDADGNTVKKTSLVKTLVCPYEIHVHALYRDVWGAKGAVGMSHAIISVKYPMDGTHEHELPLDAVFGGGKDFAAVLGRAQIIIPSPATSENTRVYLMNYLKRVQTNTPSGVDFKHFGYQTDGSFLCGETLVGSPSANTARRLKETARMYSDVIRMHGDRELWANATKKVDNEGAQCFGVSLLTACAGALGNVSGAATPLVVFVSDVSGTGKTLSLAFGNSAFMNPSDEYMFLPKDTGNSLYHSLGTFGDLSGSMDEYTTVADAQMAANLAYDISSGREKKSLTRDRKSREPESWRAPLRITSNRSLYDMFDMVQTKDEPLRLRTLEFQLDTREFVKDHGQWMYDTLQDNYGHAMPELAEAVIAMGGRKEVWRKGIEAFEKTFKVEFQSEERFYRNTIAVCWIVGKIGQKLGLFRFDVDRIINYMIARCVQVRILAVSKATDGLDLIGQFMQEYNHQLIVVRREIGKTDQVQFPVPASAVMRMEVVSGPKNPVMQGSLLAINESALKNWLRRGKDSIDRLTTELQHMGAVMTSHHRVTLFKGCPSANPGQAHCLLIDLTHPRMAAVLAGRPVLTPTMPMAAILQTQAP